MTRALLSVFFLSNFYPTFFHNFEVQFEFFGLRPWTELEPLSNGFAVVLCNHQNWTILKIKFDKNYYRDQEVTLLIGHNILTLSVSFATLSSTFQF